MAAMAVGPIRSGVRKFVFPDPGYGATARMLGESTACLVRDVTDSPLTGGILTPASGTGEPLADRLRAVGLTATVDEASVGIGD